VSENNQNTSSLSANSTGQNLTDAETLDNHYRLAKPEYDACIASVNLQSGWHVLDAGCGNGVFIPQIAGAVGPTGHIVAMDHAPENVASVHVLIERMALPAPVTTRVSSMLKLPFEENTFDCVWCANVTQYLTEAELDTAMTEFKRVVKPGGIIAIKEVDIANWQFYPIDASLLWRFLDVSARSGITQTLGALRGWAISKWMRRHSIEVIQRKSILVERTAPLPAFAIDYLGGMLKWLAEAAQHLDLSDQDKSAWLNIRDHAKDILSDPDTLYREMFVLTVGQAVK
jgi:ubiquinone/menaquinone biosynthesis C-methylase UbiE